MTKIENQMIQRGYSAEGTFDTEAEAETAAADIERCGGGQATWVRRSAAGWTVWVETDEAHQRRTDAA